jgi:hypothetical protein
VLRRCSAGLGPHAFYLSKQTCDSDDDDDDDDDGDFASLEYHPFLFY